MIRSQVVDLGWFVEPERLCLKQRTPGSITSHGTCMPQLKPSQSLLGFWNRISDTPWLHAEDCDYSSQPRLPDSDRHPELGSTTAMDTET